MFSLQVTYIIPIGDIVVVKTIKELLGIHDKQEMGVYAEKWSPYRSMATFIL
jgi:DNA-3-methyladenine glycosylase II